MDSMLKTYRYRMFGTLAASALLAVMGCGSVDSGDVLPTAPASGTLSYQGEPLAYHQVTLFPAGSQRPAAGTSDADGKFVLGTNKPGDGAIPGSHQVSVVYVGPPSSDPEAGINEFPTPPPPTVKIPEKYRDPRRSGITVEVPDNGLLDWQLELQ